MLIERVTRDREGGVEAGVEAGVAGVSERAEEITLAEEVVTASRP